MRAHAAVTGLGFPESLRWRAGELWFSDMFRGRVHRWTPGEPMQVAIDDAHGGPRMPGGLGWLPTGELLVVDADGRRVLGVAGATVREHADLTGVFSHPANDMHVDSAGRALVGGYGFDPDRDAPVASRLARVEATGEARAWGEPLVFPNGCDALSGGAVVVAETFADRLSILDGDGRRIREIAMPSGSGPDGLSVAPDGSVYVALAFAGEVVRVRDGEVRTVWRPPAGDDGPLSCYDCAVSDDGRRLAVGVASRDEAHAMGTDTGAVWLLPLETIDEGES
ncbi:SMP-30/gluconolactonase/LRE family protein [Microbacterium sp. PA5]|uniref:SMP-30/gluconolactonase/LRE family protein n=1 Tax=Microbacterium sp. PA5 TaxID=3416654 RepID=UPI003CF6F61D